MDDGYWPPAEYCLDIGNVSQAGDGTARCTAVALCDDGRPCHVFFYGQRAHFYYEFLEAISKPFLG